MQSVHSRSYYLSLLKQWTMRDLKGRYRGSVLGFAWPFLLPLMMLAVYSFVFLGVFRINVDGYVPANLYPVMLYSGLLMHGMIAEVMGRSVTIMLDQRALIKKVVFPLHILPMSLVLSAFLHLLGGVVILLVARWWLGGAVPVTALWLPVAIAPYIIMCMAVGWVLASLGVYLRDIRHLIGPLSTLLLFLGPVFYPLPMMPEAVRPFAFLNPLTVPVEAVRSSLLLGAVPDMVVLAAYWVVAVVIAVLAWAWFRVTKRGFADVL